MFFHDYFSKNRVSRSLENIYIPNVKYSNSLFEVIFIVRFVLFQKKKIRIIFSIFRDVCFDINWSQRWI